MSHRARLRRLESRVVVDSEADRRDDVLHEWFCEQLRLRGVEPSLAEDGRVVCGDGDGEFMAWLMIAKAINDEELDFPEGIEPDNFWVPRAPRSSTPRRGW